MTRSKLKLASLVIALLCLGCTQPEPDASLSNIKVGSMLSNPKHIEVDGQILEKAKGGELNDIFLSGNYKIGIVYDTSSKTKVAGAWFVTRDPSTKISYQGMTTGTSLQTTHKRLKSKASDHEIVRGKFIEFGKFDMIHLYEIGNKRYEVGSYKGTVKSIGVYDFDWMCENGPPTEICN